MIDRHTFPANGWQFTQPQTNWKAPTPLSSTFDQTVNLIIQHRLKNRAITTKHNLATNREAVAAELERFTRKRLGMPEQDTPAPFPVPRSLSNAGTAVAVAVERVKKLAAGASLLLDWEESGQVPEKQEVAEARAEICATCPKNEKGASLSEWFTVPVADLIRKKLGRVNDMKLVTSRHAELNICTACACPLPLKVFCPGDLIVKHMKPEVKKDLDPRCWILKLTSS